MKHSTELLHGVLRELGDGIIVRRVSSGNLIYATDSAARLLGVEPKELAAGHDR